MDTVSFDGQGVLVWPTSPPPQFVAIAKATREELFTPLKRYITSAIKPPFSTITVLVIAFISCGLSGTLADLVYHITRIFPYYARQAAEALAGAYSIGTCAYSFSTQFRNALADYDLPVHVDFTGPSPIYRLDVHSAICLARRALCPSIHINTLPQRISNLPPELRNMIYRLAFALPQSGINIGKALTVDTNKVSIRSRDMLDNVAPAHWNSRQQVVLSQSLNAAMTFFLKGSQMHYESMTFFYGINHFYCGTLLQLEALVEGTKTRRHNFTPSIRHLTFEFDSESRQHAPRVFKALAQLCNLQTLRIWIDESSSRVRVPKSFQRAETLNGIATLIRTLKGLRNLTSLEITGMTGTQCAKMARYVADNLKEGEMHTDFIFSLKHYQTYGPDVQPVVEALMPRTIGPQQDLGPQQYPA